MSPSPPGGSAKTGCRDGFLDDDIVNFRPVTHAPSSPAKTDPTKSALLQKLKLKKLQSPPKVAARSQEAASVHRPTVEGEALGPAVKPVQLGDPCPDHGIECNLWCLEDKMLICWRCFIFGEHRGHTLEEDRAK